VQNEEVSKKDATQISARAIAFVDYRKLRGEFDGSIPCCGCQKIEKIATLEEVGGNLNGFSGARLGENDLRSMKEVALERRQRRIADLESCVGTIQSVTDNGMA
jgi:hypothetical protein